MFFPGVPAQARTRLHFFLQRGSQMPYLRRFEDEEPIEIWEPETEEPGTLNAAADPDQQYDDIVCYVFTVLVLGCILILLWMLRGLP